MMNRKIDSIKHKEDKRLLIPSSEEAGLEQANESVESGKQTLELSLNPIVNRGQDPELYWMNKYGNDDRQELLSVDIRSLYRHEHITPELIIKNLYRLKHDVNEEESLFNINEIFGNMFDKDELEKVSSYYKHYDGWTNRLIQGDSLLVMTSLLEREGMAGQVQTIYIDPPYGINYSSNWQMKLNLTNVKDADEHLTGEPEVIKAFRDTWELGIHSYLGYLRDRLLIAREMLTDTGSCFVQISAQNCHLVRNLMDEIFGSDNFVSQIVYRTKNMTIESKLLGSVNDFIIWYAKNKDNVKFRKQYSDSIVEGDSHWNMFQLPDGSIHQMTPEQIMNHRLLPKGADPVRLTALYPIGFSAERVFEVEFKGKKYLPAKNRSWKFDRDGFKRLVDANRIMEYEGGETLNYILKLSDYPVSPRHSLWHETAPTSSKDYVVQTSTTPIQRCLLMTTDPGDLVLDPTCGSGTTAYVAEMWGRRWVTIDTSRISLNIAKIRLIRSILPHFRLYDANETDVRQGFIYERAPHITLESITTGDLSDDIILYDRPSIDRSKLRVSGPFTVETLQNFEPVSPDEFIKEKEEGDTASFENVIKDHLLSAGIKNGRKDEHAKFSRVELLTGEYINAEGFYNSGGGERKAYFHIGPKFGTVSKLAVNQAIKECRSRGDADWLVILGFSFESDITNSQQTMSMGTFEVTKARMNDDLLQDGLKKKPAKSAASFITIGEPEIKVEEAEGFATIEILGVDIYDPIKDIVKPRDLHDVAYWMVDDDYDNSNFVVKQIFFCGGNKDEFKKWKKGLDSLAKTNTRTKVQHTLRIEIDEEAFDRLYGYISHPIKIKEKDHKIAVRVISQFGEETTKVYKVR